MWIGKCTWEIILCSHFWENANKYAQKGCRRQLFTPKCFRESCECFFTRFSQLRLHIKLKFSQVGCLIIHLDSSKNLTIYMYPKKQFCQHHQCCTFPLSRGWALTYFILWIMNGFTKCLKGRHRQYWYACILVAYIHFNSLFSRNIS